MPDMNPQGEDYAAMIQCIMEGVPVDHISLVMCLATHYGRRASSANAIGREARVAEFVKIYFAEERGRSSNGKRKH